MNVFIEDLAGIKHGVILEATDTAEDLRHKLCTELNEQLFFDLDFSGTLLQSSKPVIEYGLASDCCLTMVRKNVDWTDEKIIVSEHRNSSKIQFVVFVSNDGDFYYADKQQVYGPDGNSIFTGSVTSIDISLERDLLAIANRDEVIIMSLKSEGIVFTFSVPSKCSKFPLRAMFSKESNTDIIVNYDNTVSVINISTGETIHRYEHLGAIFDVDISTSGGGVVAGVFGYVLWWPSTASNSSWIPCKIKLKNNTPALRISVNQSSVVVDSLIAIEVYCLQTGERQYHERCNEEYHVSALSPCGKFLFSVDPVMQITILETNKSTPKVSAVTHAKAAFSPNGRSCFMGGHFRSPDLKTFEKLKNIGSQYCDVYSFECSTEMVM